MASSEKQQKVLSIITLLLGLGAAGSALGSLMGLSNPTYAKLALPPAIPLDNNLRFYAGLWFALGLIAIWVSRRLEHEPALFRAIFISIFMGGFGRVLSMTFAGMPPPEFIAYSVIEIFGAPAVLYWHYRVFGARL